MKIAVIVGSLRKDSWTRKVANAMIDLAPKSLSFDHVEIGALPHYSQDLETDRPPAEWVAFRDRIRPVDGVLFATPEYNRSVPGVLKNAIDFASRPYGQSAWNGKPGAVISVSPGAIGGFGECPADCPDLNRKIAVLDRLPRPRRCDQGVFRRWSAGLLQQQRQECDRALAERTRLGPAKQNSGVGTESKWTECERHGHWPRGHPSQFFRNDFAIASRLRGFRPSSCPRQLVEGASHARSNPPCRRAYAKR